MRDLVTIADANGRIEYVNKAVEEVTGYSRDELVGTRSRAWLPWYQGVPFLDEMQRTVLSGRPYRAGVLGRRKTGEAFLAEETVTPLAGPTGALEGILSTARDVTEQRLLECTLDHRARHEPLTGLPNRRHLLRLLDEALLADGGGARSAAVLAVDLDRFTQLNDLVGSAAGDQLLAEVAQRLREVARDRDLVARLGADEFALVLADQKRWYAFRVAKAHMLQQALIPALAFWILCLASPCLWGAPLDPAQAVVAVVSLDGQGQPRRQGLGVAIGKNGKVLTSASLLTPGGASVVRTGKGTKYLVQEVLYQDALQDLAVVQVAADQLPGVDLGAAGKARPAAAVRVGIRQDLQVGLKEAQVESIHPFSPRLTLVKLKPSLAEAEPGGLLEKAARAPSEQGLGAGVLSVAAREQDTSGASARSRSNSSAPPMLGMTRSRTTRANAPGRAANSSSAR